MKQVVYVDVLVALNIIISFFLIRSVSAITREKPKSLRVLAGSAMGGAYSLVIFLPEMHIVLSIAARMAFLFAVTAAVFGFFGVRRFFRCYVLLCTFTVLCAGAAVAACLLFFPGAAVLRNGSFYIDISFVQLVCVCAAVYIVALIFGRFLSKRSSEEINVRLKITYKGKTVSASGIIDTGNTLNDSFTGEPVSVISQNLALGLLPDEYAVAAVSPLSENLPEGMHLIVSDTVGASALMCAFAADSMTVTAADRHTIVAKPMLAVSCAQSFSGDKNVLVNAAFINDIMGGRDSENKTRSIDNENKAKAEKARRLLHKRPGNVACTPDVSSGKRGDATHRRR